MAVLFIYQPGLLVIKMGIATDPCPRVECVRQDTSRSLERMSVAVVSPEGRERETPTGINYNLIQLNC